MFDMKLSKNEQIEKGLKGRREQIEIWRDQQWGNATSLYINQFLTSEEYLSISQRINSYFDTKIEQDNQLADKIRNS